MGNYTVKEIKNVYKFAGTEEVNLQDFDSGVIFPEFCLLWKDGKSINKKFIKELLKIKDEVEELNKKRISKGDN